MKVVRTVGWKFVSVMKRMLSGTPIQKWPVTSRAYAKFISIMYEGKDITTRYKGVDLVLPSKDPSIVPPILGGNYESFELDVFKALATCSARDIMDIGGNIGLYAVIAGKLHPKGKVVSFEPIADNFLYLERNIALNKLKNVKAMQAAVGEQTGRLEIFLSRTSIGHHSAAVQQGSTESVSVPMVSVDDYVKRKRMKPQILKIDVEGYDFYVLEGAQETLKKHQPTVFVEYGPGLIKKNGYTPKKFLNILFSYAKKAYLFEESSRQLKPVTKSELLRKESSFVGNLLFVADKGHQKVVTQFLP